MTFRRLTPSLISTPEQLDEVLLQRIPREHREEFFSAPHPTALSSEATGINPNLLQAAVDRIRQAITVQETVVIYGDYDCDGVTATAILWLTLRHLGLKALPFLPHRERHGYGLSIAGLEEIWQKAQPTLVITVDNGIVANEGIAWLKRKGVDVIVTDHHEAGSQEPPADVILHSTNLCGATVSWMLAHALDPEFAQEQLDLAAVGTIADQVPLFGANRSFAVHGLSLMRQQKRESLRSLAEVAGFRLEEADSSTVHFGIAPRINAMGRLYEATEALRALVSNQRDRSLELMRRLQQVNAQRQELTNRSIEQVLKQIQTEDESIVVAAGDFHEGVIGLIASKLVDRTGKPSIVISLGDEKAKASCRSIAGFHMTHFLRGLKDVPFLSLGGHAMAAGFSLAAENANAAISTIRSEARQKIDRSIFSSSTLVVGELDPQLLNRRTAKQVQRFAPFGAGNEQPLFLLPNCLIQSVREVGQSGAHAQITLEYGGTRQQAIWFNYKDRGWQEKSKNIDVAVSLSESTFRGREIEIQVQTVASPV